jgi:hypothetical protein
VLNRGRSDGYRRVLATRGAPIFFVATLVARTGIAMTSFGVIWLVHWRTGSFGSAGVVGGTLAIAEAGVGPQVARAVDRRGQNKVLPRWLAAHGVAVACLVAAVLAGCPSIVLVVLGAFVGGSIPQIGALSAARWSALLGGTPALPSAFALEALSNDLAYLAGPAAVGTISTTISPAVGSALAAALILVGGLVLVMRRGTVPPPATRESGTSSWIRKLVTPGFSVLVGVSFGFGFFFGCLQVSVAAFTTHRHAADLAGPLYSLMAGVSMVAGLCYGLRRWRMRHTTQLLLTVSVLLVGCLLAMLANTLPGLAPALVVSGLAIAPSLTLLSVLTEAVVDRVALTQALTWLSSAGAAGVAAAVTLTGREIDGAGSRWGFGTAFVAVSLMAIMIYAGRSALLRSARNAA